MANNIPKVAVVLGATGLIGNHLVEQLINNSSFEQVTAITRRPVDFKSNKVVNRVIDFNHMEQYADCFVGDVLFSCLGTTKSQAGSIDAQRRVDVDYQLEAAQLGLQGGVKHMLLVSSSGANSQSRAPYFKMKGELEDIISALAFEKTSIVQPSLLTGSRDHFRLGETLASYIIPILCVFPPFAKYKPITGQQVAKKMVDIATIQQEKMVVYKLDELFNLSR